mgnify:CR=1 FL=1
MIKCYAAYSKDKDLRLASSSGAMFSLLAIHIISKGGIVYGVKMTKDCYGAEYKRAVTSDDLSEIRGSKYFQAKVGDTYKSVKNDLISGRIVLFTGTGCYVNGLKTFLQKDYDNLICMDIVCHGTPSPELWKKYVMYREEQKHSKMIYASFRNKDKYDWKGFEMKEIDENQNEVWISRHIDPYFTMFVKNICLRPSCYTCSAKSYKLSDITIADFWGIDKVAPEMNDNLGISLVIVRTDKGQHLFDLVQDFLERKEVRYEDGVRDNKAEYEPYSKPKERETFFKDMNNLPFDKLSHRYVDVPLWKKYAQKMKRVFKQVFVRERGGGTSKHIHTHEDYGMLLRFENKNC